MTYRVATIIVTYNSARHIERCLLGLREASYSAILYIMVVDNASTDKTLQIVRHVAGDIDIVSNEANLGYAKANNQAIEMLAQYGFNYYLILNPDVVVPPGLLHKLLRVMEIDERIGIVSPNVFQGRLDKGHSEIEGMWSLWGVPVRRRPHGAHIWFVDRLPGSCMLIRSSVFEKVGLLDESFFLYWEEIDLCLRARQAGFRLAVCPDAEVLHQPGEPSGAKSERAHRIYYMWRNQVRFAFKNYGTFRGNFFLARRSVTMLKETIQYLRARRMDLLKAGWCGFLAGVQGETGKSDHPLADPDRASSLIAG